MKIERFPRYPLTFGPTHIHPLNRLSAHLGGKVKLYAKREDCNSGLAFGGNKTRKLEYLIPDVLEQGADTLVSIGGIQSNQTRQVAAVAAHLGLRCVLVQENWANYSDAVYDRVGNIQMSRIMGADVRLVCDGFDIGIRKSWQEAWKVCLMMAENHIRSPLAALNIPWAAWVLSDLLRKFASRRWSLAFALTISSCAL